MGSCRDGDLGLYVLFSLENVKLWCASSVYLSELLGCRVRGLGLGPREPGIPKLRNTP